MHLQNKAGIITNGDLRDNILKQVKKVPEAASDCRASRRILLRRSDWPRSILLHRDPDAILGLFPSDQVITDEKRFRRELGIAVKIAAAGENIVVMGDPPQSPGDRLRICRDRSGLQGRRNAGAPIHRKAAARSCPTIRDIRELLLEQRHVCLGGQHGGGCTARIPSQDAHLARRNCGGYGTRKFESTFKRLYPKCDNISVDYAVMEPRSARGEQSANIYCVPADFGWNDLGSWAALFEHHVSKQRAAMSFGQSDCLASMWRAIMSTLPASSWQSWA